MLKQRQSEFIRQIKLVPDFIELKNYSVALNVSEKTLSRDIKYLNDNYFKYPVCILAKRGVGVALQATQSEYVSILNEISIYECQNLNVEISNTVRPYYVLLYLLLNANKELSQQELSEVFYVSKSVINSDLKTVQNVLNEELLLDKSTKGTSVRGIELEIRNAIVLVLILIHDQERQTSSSLVLDHVIPKHFESVFTFEVSIEISQLADRLLLLINSMAQNTLTWEDKRKLYCGLFVLMYKYEMGVEKNELNNEIIIISDVDHLLFPMANYLYREINDIVSLDESEISYILYLLKNINTIKKLIELQHDVKGKIKM